MAAFTAALNSGVANSHRRIVFISNSIEKGRSMAALFGFGCGRRVRAKRLGGFVDHASGVDGDVVLVDLGDVHETADRASLRLFFEEVERAVLGIAVPSLPSGIFLLASLNDLATRLD
ncbi:conserved hypothetical protein [Ricinus communis]|uniref:Uncharacterized protein n=1 Tax=Ricinus communis TaxID=3988 RepID=B9TE91_RICCO|nr:conserved hypothetical protein [Ricinus communis]